MYKYWVMGLAIACFNPAMAVEINEHLEVSGTLDVEYGAVRGDVEHEQGSYVAMALVGATVRPNDKLDMTANWIYEENINSVETPVEVDEAYATWHAKEDGQLDVSFGKKYLPFGDFETAMVSDPLTLELGETRHDRVLQASGKHGSVDTAGYVFKGETENGYGGSLNYGTEQATVGLDYLSHFLDEDVPALALHGTTGLGKITLRGEHLSATKALDDGAKPAASRLEADIDLNSDRTLAVAWNATQEAETLELPERAYGVTYRQPLYKALSGGLELMQAKHYSGDTANSLNAQLLYEF